MIITRYKHTSKYKSINFTYQNSMNLPNLDEVGANAEAPTREVTIINARNILYDRI